MYAIAGEMKRGIRLRKEAKRDAKDHTEKSFTVGTMQTKSERLLLKYK